MAIQLHLLPLMFVSVSVVCAAATAAQVLSSVGMLSMSLTLQYGPQTLIHPLTQNLTIFSPADTIFAKFGQPSLSLLRFHFSPQSLPFSFLNSHPFGSQIATFSPTHSLILTSSPSDDQFSLNGVKIGERPVYDDGFLIVYKIDKFFDPSFKVSDDGCVGGHTFRNTNSFDKASEALRSKGYFAMASFLESQLESPKDRNLMLTIFAPSDEMVKPLIDNWSLFPSTFLKLIVPCKIPGRALVSGDKKKMLLETYLEGFNITVNKSGTDVLINGVKVIAWDLFQSDWLVVHGLGQGISRVASRNGVAEKPKFNKVFLAISCLFLSFHLKNV